MFSTPHLIVIGFTIIVAPIIALHLKKCSEKTIDIFFKSCAVLSLFFDPIYWIWEFQKNGSLDFSRTLPIYICSLFWLMMPFAAFAKDNLLRRIARANIATVVCIGGILGLIFNVYVGQYPFFSFVPLRSLIYHILMIVVAISMWTTGYYKPQKRDDVLCMIPFLALLIVAKILNTLYGWDYFYTAGGEGTPFELLSSKVPMWAFMLILYGGLYLLIRLVFYTVPEKKCYIAYKK